MTPDRLPHLVSLYFDGVITPAEVVELDRLLLNDAGLRVRFWQEAWADSALREWGDEVSGIREMQNLVFGVASAKAAGPSVNAIATRPRKAKPRFEYKSMFRLAAASAAAVSIAVLGLIIHYSAQSPVQQPQITQHPITPGTTVSPIGRLMESTDAVWTDGPSSTDQGTLYARTYQLLSGSVRIELPNGVRLWLGGASNFRPVSPSRFELQLGHVVAHVPQSGKGFTVAVQGMDVEDLGTEFGVRVDRAGASQVHVFTGEVRLHPSADGGVKPAQLQAGEAIARTADGRISELSLDLAGFERATPADVRVDFKSRSSTHQPISGVYRGIDFGASGPEGWGVGVWKGELALDIHTTAKSSVQELVLPAGTTLKGLTMQSDLASATITLRSPGNPEVTFRNVPPTYGEFRTGWKVASPRVTVSVTSTNAVSDLDITQIVYGLP